MLGGGIVEVKIDFNRPPLIVGVKEKWGNGNVFVLIEALAKLCFPRVSMGVNVEVPDVMAVQWAECDFAALRDETVDAVR